MKQIHKDASLSPISTKRGDPSPDSTPKKSRPFIPLMKNNEKLIEFDKDYDVSPISKAPLVGKSTSFLSLTL
jgi:hypothetical protein